MEPIQNSCTLYEYLNGVSKEHIQNVVIDCLFQVCAIVWYLEHNFGINHRDLKPSNFLIVEHEPIVKHLKFGEESCDIKSRYSITLIDFGFSCLGSTETKMADISLSTVYSKEDPCPKEGRDLYLFIAFLYLEFYTKLPERFLKLLEQWLEVPGSNIITFLQKDRQNSKKWIYFLTGNHKITKFNCCPGRILRDLREFVR
jgi:serine/threonine protein kinase